MRGGGADSLSHNTITRWIRSRLFPCLGTSKMSVLMFSSIHVFRPEGQIWYPVRRETKTNLYTENIKYPLCAGIYQQALFRNYGTKLIVDTVNYQYFSKGDFSK